MLNPIQASGAKPRELLLKVVTEMAQAEFDYGGHGELPIRNDSHKYLVNMLFHESHEHYFDRLIAEAIGMNFNGVPYLVLSCPATDRRVTFSIPCYGVVCWTKVFRIQKPPGNQVTRIRPFNGNINEPPDEESQIVDYARIDTLDSEDWGKLEAVFGWMKSRLIIPSPLA